MKNADVTLKEYARRLSDDDLQFLVVRHNERLGGDQGEFTNFVSQNRDLDRWLGSATNSSEFFSRLDEIGDSILKECERRYGRKEDVA